MPRCSAEVMMTPKLIVSDLDGTLLRADGSVSARSVAALDRVQAAGVSFAMVTGRPVRWLPEVLDRIGPRGPVVCANGAVIYDPDTDRILAESPLDVEVIAEVIDRLRGELPEVVCAVETEQGRRMLSEAGYHSPSSDIERRIVEHAELVSAPAVKLLARLPNAAPEKFFSRCVALLDGSVDVTRSSTQPLVEISATGVTKASGLAWLADHYGVGPDAVVAYGDMPNDVPMFAWAGRGVAVANAHPMLLDVADEVTGANDDDGVATHMEKLLP